ERIAVRLTHLHRTVTNCPFVDTCSPFKTERSVFTPVWFLFDRPGAPFSRNLQIIGQARITQERKVQLHGRDFKYATFDGSDFSGYDFEAANFYGASLVGVNLEKADLTLANLNHTDLTGAKLGSAELYSALINFASLRGVRAAKAQLSRAQFVGS